MTSLADTIVHILLASIAAAAWPFVLRSRAEIDELHARVSKLENEARDD